jgi:hypothetical protein
VRARVSATAATKASIEPSAKPTFLSPRHGHTPSLGDMLINSEDAILKALVRDPAVASAFIIRHRKAMLQGDESRDLFADRLRLGEKSGAPDR